MKQSHRTINGQEYMEYIHIYHIHTQGVVNKVA